MSSGSASKRILWQILWSRINSSAFQEVRVSYKRYLPSANLIYVVNHSLAFPIMLLIDNRKFTSLPRKNLLGGNLTRSPFILSFSVQCLTNKALFFHLEVK